MQKGPLGENLISLTLGARKTRMMPSNAKTIPSDSLTYTYTQKLFNSHTCPVLSCWISCRLTGHASTCELKLLSLVVTPSSLVYDTHGLLALLCFWTICNMSHNEPHPSVDSLASIAHPHTCVIFITYSSSFHTLHPLLLHTHTCTHTCTHTHAHAYTCTRTRTHTCTHTHSCTCTHAHSWL